MAVLTSFVQSSPPDSSAQKYSSALIELPDRIASPFPSIPKPLSLLNDTLTTPLGWVASSLETREIEVYIDRDWEYITLTEYINDEIYRIPFTAPLEWYISQMIKIKRQIIFTEKVSLNLEEEEQRSTRGGKGITFDLVDMGALGTASLRVRGNINISGKMVFQDQELVRSSLAEAQNTHLEFDQKQNLKEILTVHSFLNPLN